MGGRWEVTRWRGGAMRLVVKGGMRDVGMLLVMEGGMLLALFYERRLRYRRTVMSGCGDGAGLTLWIKPSCPNV